MTAAGPDAVGRSADFEEFRRTFFGTDHYAYHEGPNPDALARLVGEERHEAERMLLAGLERGESRAALGVGVLKIRDAVPALERIVRRRPGLLGRLLRTELGPLRAGAGAALWQLTGAEEGVRAAVEVLEGAWLWSHRIDAALALREVRHPLAEAALARAARDDRNELVRTNALRALYILRGREAEVWPPPPGDPSLDAMSRDPAVRARAVDAALR